ncbi:MAG TPA: M67 family metallopeptidase [Anaerolineae bacterium]|nr:M67 family metallopeptidase [Anaerolineae bacterium]
MTLVLDHTQLVALQQYVEGTYPYEGGGLLVGQLDQQGRKIVEEIKPFENQRAIADQHNRILITDRMYREGEAYADAQGLLLIGFFHSHPDHPARPSEFDRDHALPWWSYVIVSVQQGKAAETLSWELKEDRSAFCTEEILLHENTL